MKLRTYHYILALFLILGITFLLRNGFDVKAEGENRSSEPPKLLLFTELHPQELKENAKFWAENSGFRGFMLCHISQFWIKPEDTIKMIPYLKTVNDECRKYGIDSNFVRFHIGLKDNFDMTNDKCWEDTMRYLRAAAKTAKEAGFAGVAFDTEAYKDRIFSEHNSKYAKLSEEERNALFYKRGREAQSVISQEFPDGENIVILEGYFYYKYSGLESPREFSNNYRYWLPFFKGMLSVKPQKGIVLGCERSYEVTGQFMLKQKYDSISKLFNKDVDFKDYWNDKCSIALGSWPLGRRAEDVSGIPEDNKSYYQDKENRYSAAEFKTQLLTAKSLCKKYVWIYDHGVCWKTTPEPVLDRYEKMTGIVSWNKGFQAYPVGKLLPEFLEITKLMLN